jgi:hypothetical protein
MVLDGKRALPNRDRWQGLLAGIVGSVARLSCSWIKLNLDQVAVGLIFGWDSHACGINRQLVSNRDGIKEGQKDLDATICQTSTSRRAIALYGFTNTPAPWHNDCQVGNSLAVKRSALDRVTLVRIQVSQPNR